MTNKNYVQQGNDKLHVTFRQAAYLHYHGRTSGYLDICACMISIYTVLLWGMCSLLKKRLKR